MTTQDQAQAPGATGATNEEEPLDLGNDGPGAPEGAGSTGAEVLDIEEDDAGKGGKGGGQGIPRARLNEVNERRRQTEEQLAQRERENAELRAQLAALIPGQPAATAAAPAAPAFDLDAAEDRYTAAMMDGDAAAARAVRREINQYIEDSAVERLESRMSARQASTLADQVVTNAIAQYPWLDGPEGEEALEVIEALHRNKIAQGIPKHEALAQAIASTVTRFAPTPSRELPGKGAPVDTRLAAADKRGAAHSLLQPPGVQAGMGNRADPAAIDTSKMTDDEFNALPEAEKKKALGY
ncbi:hypothetical protein LJR066_005710 [Acidovorax sp. LjRoot66]|uniref:hypothetical protein n=1 Tax=Acidovorax sp. LjRoot66 TaxID=3342334 RepID=UPI003ED0C9F5